jgi:predicted nucleotidyltransferase
MGSVKTATLMEKVATCVSRKREVQAAYLFGSHAKGRARAASDVDIAILLDPSVEPSERFDYRLELMADLGATLELSDVDLVILNDAPTLLAHRVLSEGKLVFERSPSARIHFQVRTAARYLDLIPVYETHIRYLKQSVREDRVVG